jgi:peptidoglycan/LPS O-acetylase OafA/YrhL
MTTTPEAPRRPAEFANLIVAGIALWIAGALVVLLGSTQEHDTYGDDPRIPFMLFGALLLVAGTVMGLRGLWWLLTALQAHLAPAPGDEPAS